jgi:hypothetical protein
MHTTHASSALHWPLVETRGVGLCNPLDSGFCRHQRHSRVLLLRFATVCVCIFPKLMAIAGGSEREPHHQLEHAANRPPSVASSRSAEVCYAIPETAQSLQSFPLKPNCSPPPILQTCIVPGYVPFLFASLYPSFHPSYIINCPFLIVLKRFQFVSDSLFVCLAL